MKPVVLGTDDVEAILEGRRTALRRPVKLRDFQLSTTLGVFSYRDREARWHEVPRDSACDLSPIRTGDTLYVRETWALDPEQNPVYRAGSTPAHKAAIRWRSHLHMPRGAARIFLKVTETELAPLHLLIESDAEEEGYEADGEYDALEQLLARWECTYPKYRAAKKPWVWTYRFERIASPAE